MSRKSFDGGGFLTFYQQLAVNNPCYKSNGNRSRTTHLILHSTGANNPNLKRYVTPDDGFLGVNPYNNGWNNAASNTLVHGVIGKNKDGVIEAYQIAPWGKLVWGCGSGKNGSGNSFAIQVEMCEDQTLGASYAKECYAVAVKLFAYLAKAFNISVENIWSHNEAHHKGYASGHVDPEHWWKAVGAGLTMDGFRKDVSALLGGKVSTGETTSTKTEKPSTSKTEASYSAQIGAFQSKSGAQSKLKAVKADGYEAFLVQVGTWWKIHVGKSRNKAEIEALVATLKKDGYTAIVVKASGNAAAITVGSTVRVKQGTKTYDGKPLKSFVYGRDHKVKQISGDRVVITFDGVVVAAVHYDNLTLV